MAFTRKNVAAAVAGTLSLAMLTGCPAPAPTGTSPSAPASAAPSAPTSAAPTTATSAAPSAQPTGTASGAPASAAPSVAVSAPPASGKTVIVSGTIYNEKGATVDGAAVTVKSLDTSVPYTATVNTTAGSYVVNNVPEGANVEVIVTKDGWTSRRRVQSFQQSATGQKNVLNFGGTSVSGGDNSGLAYFISDYPEIAATTPAHDDKNIDPTKMNIKVVLSEALDEDSRDAFEKAFRILPANQYALKAADLAVFVDIEAKEDVPADHPGLEGLDPTNTGNIKYSIAEGDTFLGSTTNRVKATWNAAGTEVTFTFDGNLQANESEAAEYQMALVSFTGFDIKDAKNNRLGTSKIATDTFSTFVNQRLIFNAFKDPDLAVTVGNNGLVAAPWADTHKSAISFEVKEDETDPKLTGVNAVKDGDNLRIELVFSEPLAAYYGSGTGNANVDAATVFDLDNYSFMVGKNSGDLASMELDGDPAASINLDDHTKSYSTNLTAIGAKTEFELDAATNADGNNVVIAGNQGKDLQTNSNATLAMEVEPDNPTIVNIWIKGGRDMFTGFRSLKARVANIKDPAGNNITSTDADKNLASSSI